MQKVLTVAGSDSGGGAGIQADLKTMTVHNVYGASVITALTAQNTLGVQEVSTVELDFIASQFDSVFQDINFDAAKTGMLATKEIVVLTSEKFKEYNQINLVVDPVMVATSGDLLLERTAVDAYREKLLPLAKVVTPNLNEARVLAGYEPDAEVDPKELARKIYDFGSEYVLVKGGHSNIEATVSGRTPQVTDILYDGENFTELSGQYIKTNNTHGTGCTLSASIASNLALGLEVGKALEASKQYITRAIKDEIEIGSGNNPVNHLVKDIERGEAT